MKLMMITAQPDIARFAVTSGVDRIFVDLECIGKKERQKNRDTWISPHTFDDVAAVRAAIGSAPLLVRLNPWHHGSAYEIEEAIRHGANYLMLPMFRTHNELADFCHAVDGRVPVVPLVETAESFALIDSIALTPGVGEVFIGLNDLHISLGMTFMFEPLARGHLDRAAALLHQARMSFGFGGIARIGEGLLSAEKILSEHVRLGSSSVILSRSFHHQCSTLDDLKSKMDLAAEISRLRSALAYCKTAGSHVLERNRSELVVLVEQIVREIHKKQTKNSGNDALSSTA